MKSNGMSQWNMECLLCGHRGTDLVKMQEHGMSEHEIPREGLWRTTRQPKELTASDYVWSLEDGRPWLRAVKVPGFMDEVQAVAEGKIKCACGNSDWRQFIYAGADVDHLVAGCKKCGQAQPRKDGAWQTTTN